jgi:hypothetical protein
VLLPVEALDDLVGDIANSCCGFCIWWVVCDDGVNICLELKMIAASS